MNAAAQDAATALRWLRANADSYNLDPDRIAIGGSSAGAITSLYTAYQEADMIGNDADVSVILDLWGAMYGAEILVDADDPPVFIVHGTRDRTVAVENSENLVNRLETVGLNYRYFPIEGERHGPWSSFFNNVVEGKTIDRHCAEFFFNHLGLIELHPGPNVASSMSINEAGDALALSVGTETNFQYQLLFSDDLIEWNPAHPEPIAGDGEPLEIDADSNGVQGFYRWRIAPAF